MKVVIRNRDEILASGQVPESVFIGVNSQGILTWTHENKPAVLLFTTPYALLDYTRAFGMTFGVGQAKLDALPEVGRVWASQGVEKFGLNRCPRCPVMNLWPIEALGKREQFLTIWAAERATKRFQGEVKVREFMHYLSSSHEKARAALELIRDHIDCGIPYVYEFIALVARMDNDGAAKDAAIERLKEFGPAFADFETKWSTAGTPKAIAEAFVGLHISFGMPLPDPSQKATAPTT